MLYKKLNQLKYNNGYNQGKFVYDGSSKEGSKQPPVGEWIELDEFEGDKTIRQGASFNFSLKCIVYDVWGYSAEDIHSITVE